MSAIRTIPVNRVFFCMICVCLLALFLGGVTTKKMSSQAFSALALLGLLSLAFRWRADLAVKTPSVLKKWGAVCCLLWLFALLAWAVNGFHEQQVKALSSPYGKLLLFPLVVLALSYFSDLSWLKQVKIFFSLVFLGAIITGFLATDSRWGWVGLVPVTSRAGFAVNPIYYGDVSLCLGFINGLFSIYFLSKGKFSLAILAGIGLLMGCTASAISLSRGGWLALPVFLSIITFYLVYLKFFKFLLFSLALMLIGLSSVIFTDNPLKDRVVTGYQEVQQFDVKDSRTSVGYRLRMWSYAIDSFQGKPLLGGGPMSYRFEDYDANGAVITHFDHAHNGYLQTLTTMGISGLLIYLAVFLYPLIYFIRRFVSRRAIHSSLIGIAVISSFMVFDLTDVIFYRSVGLIFFLVIVSLCMLMTEKESQEKYL